jgi:hypothetical protein
VSLRSHEADRGGTVEHDEEMFGSPTDRGFPRSPADTRPGYFWVFRDPVVVRDQTGDKK